MPKMTDPRELFLHELGDVLYAENVLVKALPKLADEASDDKLRAGFEAHLEETKQHVKNVEKAFAKLGEKALGREVPGDRRHQGRARQVHEGRGAVGRDLRPVPDLRPAPAPSTTRSPPTRASSPVRRRWASPRWPSC